MKTNSLLLPPLPVLRRFSSLPAQGKAAFVATLSDREAAILASAWEAWAREKQLAPAGSWTTWLLLAGRGFGKTRAGAEWIRHHAEQSRVRRMALIGRTAADVRDTMVEGESGILAISPSWFRPAYNPSKRRLTWPNGCIATTFSAEEPDSLRGPQHEKIWADEPAAWRFSEAWDQAMFGLRLGGCPQIVATTTPRPTRLIRALIAQSTTVVTSGTSYENKQNLAPTFFAQIVAKYEGTRLGRQELEAVLLEDAEGALWKRDAIESLRVTRAPDLVRIVVAIDPAVTSEEGSDETGIVVIGLSGDQHLYVLDDLSGRMTPRQWAVAAVSAYHKYHADRIVAETNNGGDMVELTVHSVDPAVAYKKVTATREKRIRAEPISAVYEQGRAHHVGAFPALEDQMCQWEYGQKSPDRIDALVWGGTELLPVRPLDSFASDLRERLTARETRRKELAGAIAV